MTQNAEKGRTTASDVLAAYRRAQIASREFDEGDDEMQVAWRTAYLAHVAWDPTLAPEPTEAVALGLATTRDLLEELKARGEISVSFGEYPQEMGDMAIGAARLLDDLPGSMLEYRTVDGQ